MTDKHTEALEKLNRGIQESRQEVQKRTMNLAQGYFDDSAEALKQHIKENRDALKNLPDQIPGGREEAFQTLFQELMDNYSSMEECINEAQENVASLDTDQIRRQGEVEATDAARRQAQELGIDLTEIEGTGTDGRIIVSDVVEAAEAMEDGAAGGAAQQAQGTAGQAAGQAQQAAGQATDQAGQAAQGVQDTVGGLTGGQGGGGPLGGVTDKTGQVAGQAQEAVGGAAQQAQDTAGQAQEAAGQATDQAGQAAGQAQDAAGGAARQAQDTAGQAAQVAQGTQGTVGQATGQAGQIADQADGGAEDMDAQIVASDAARREAKERGIDLSKVRGTGAEGRIVYWDVADPASEEEGGIQGADDAASQAVGAADQAGQGNAAQGGAEEPKVTKAAKRKAEAMGADLSKIKGSGAGGLITIKDVAGA